MSDSDKPARPATSDTGRTRAAERQERLAAALRANLKRRKAQARTRADDGGEHGEKDPAEG